MISFKVKDRGHLYQLIGGVAAAGAIFIGCVMIMAPFFPAILLAIIFTLSAWPAFEWLKNRLGHRTALAATIVTIALAACFIAPLVIIGTSSSDNFTKTYNAVQATLQGDTGQIGGLLKSLPFIGDELSRHWNTLTSDKERLKAIMEEYAGPASQALLTLGKTIGRGIVDISLGVIFAYFFFRHGTNVAVRVRNLIDKLWGPQGQHLLQVSKKTVIGVVYGILGTALAQGVLAALGYWIADVPGATFLGLMTFFLAFIPMGPVLVWLPAAFWLISEGQTNWGIFLFLWGVLLVSTIDNFLKPYFISIGSNLPFLLVLIAIAGGVMTFGFIGLFIGPTLLALTYSLLLEWSGTRSTRLPLEHREKK